MTTKRTHSLHSRPDPAILNPCLAMEVNVPQAIDMTGSVYGRLTITGQAPNRGKRRYWHALCECGNAIEVDGAHVRYGRIVSCGCYNREIITSDSHADALRSVAGSTRTHGQSKLAVYAVWKTMRQRCNNPKCADYRYYGALGVQVSDAWNDFTVFYEDMGDPPKDKPTLDRIDPEGDYEKSNCRWADWQTQRQNRRVRQ